jgi:CBS domain-containing membrane protein
MAPPSARLGAPVETVMSRRVTLIREGVPMSEVRSIAVQYDFNDFPVAADDGRLIGMITKGDLLRVVQAAMADPTVWQQPVARWMAHGVLALRQSDSLETAVTRMVDSGLRSLPVIDGSGHVVGIVSRNDVMAAIEREMWA